MKAFVIPKYGKNDVLELRDVERPQVEASDVLIQIRAVSVNPVDFKIRQGLLRFVLPYRLPFILGNDCSGIVQSVGPAVTKFKKGDEVYTRPDKDRIGTFSEYISVQQDAVCLKPKNISFEEAASLPLVGLTCWQTLMDKAQIKSGDKVFIPAGSGGVGTFAIQLAKHLGAYVATTTSTKNVAFVKCLGADEVIDYKKENFWDRLKHYDFVFDTLGGYDQKMAFKVLKPNTKMISIVGPPTMALAKEHDLGLFIKLVSWILGYKVMKIAKKHHVDYSFLFMIPSGEQLSLIKNLVEAGIIKPHIDRTFPFNQTKEALAFVETGRARGKVVIQVGRT